jgi:uncharacterized cupin superfamily protein
MTLAEARLRATKYGLAPEGEGWFVLNATESCWLLVVAGECVLIVEGEERSLRAWDFFHCAGGTAHAIVGAGDGPAVVLAVGARGGRKGITYLVAPAALAHGAAVSEETTKSAEAYAGFPQPKRVPCREGWLPVF